MGTAYPGRSTVFLWGGSVVEGVKSKSLKINGDAIDITSDDDSGFQTFLATHAGLMSAELSISGVVKDDRFISDIMAGSFQRALQLTFPNGKVLSGTFHLEVTSRNMDFKDAVAFDASLKSSGVFTFA